MKTNNSVENTSKNLEETNISDDVKELREEKRRSRKDKIRERRIESKKWVRESSFFAKVKKAMPFSKVIGKIFMIYLFTVLFTGFLLMIPGIISVSGSEYNWDYISGIFNASAALSDTGIVTAPVWSTYTFWGQLILLILFQLGGIGVLTIKITLLIMLNKKISVNDQITAQTERGGIALSNTTEMIKDAFVFLIIVEIIGSFVLFFGFYFIEVDHDSLMQDGKAIGQSPFRNFEMSLWFSIFHSVSAVNNAGMDIFSDNSLQGYNTNPYGYSIQSVFLIQWVIGGLGYPTYHDVKKKIRAMKTGEHVQFSLFTKLNFTVYSALFFIGPLLVFFTELSSGQDSNILYTHNISDGVDTVTAVSWHKGLFDIVFNVSASRNSGFTTIDIRSMNEGSRVVLSTLMFIGSAPSSTAGGIRTTTFAILLILCWSVIRNKKSVSAFSKTIPQDTVRKSMAVFVVSMILSVSMIFIIYVDSYTQAMAEGFDMTDIMVLVFSAFGTVGFSPYNTHIITSFGMASKFALIITMFIGQLGISNTLLAFVKPSSKERFKYLEQDVMIG
ncbi:potassium uptake protein KtrB [Spiroplasma sp. TIUS-1]|uniref:TrkH family potassium uptake protein n=1 Tax=Spiroplasma sp. TIUS-1 TaxID=216963 RepID=UPI001397E058|nr:potassium transporter TrkG [Spiroplasma sp. TIUS-1]QHX36121.1 potassium uptake protein KtrB [Spiroplasma sp. TIUS-1]